MQPDQDDYLAVPVQRQLDGFTTGELSPVRLAETSFQRALKHAELNFIRLRDWRAVAAEAEASERRWRSGHPIGKLDGVVVTIKDNCLVSGMTTTWGSKVKQVDATEDSPPVARLREAGAIILGLTTLPEWGWKGVTDSPLTGITRNPWMPSRTSGGSSGGAAVAAALGVAALNLGSDGAGSIRIPASFCGVFGFKPTFGVVPAYPLSALPEMVTYGPITQNVDDADIMLDILRGPDWRDWIATSPALQRQDSGGPPRIAYSRTLGFASVDSEVLDVTDRAVQALEKMGWEIDEVDHVFDDPWDIVRPLYFGGLGYMVGATEEAARPEMDPNLVSSMQMSPTSDEIYAAAIARQALGRCMNLFHQRFDLLLTPQMPLTAFEAGRDFPEGRGMSNWFQWNPFTYPFNLTQQPAASIPCGNAASGLPVGLQVVGRRFSDLDILSFCRRFEGSFPFPCLHRVS
ncbi:Aspartyl-tRNA(Asn)/glutamyl-tRNA(Gln) amidotransferase subunit A [Hyphomicrobiales bacterium]|nr:Aspartyl-tRNA(Asn)/glutamyl-tRNA(Gln) amidotransferase subunit A [Hyphomicrobiales bacterium]CAH1691178.1 Aspartyl-tRNA(Asn)/glutamyl-tRNA(Gln) amidotransferase subunit A [Hyphomicrobiales bacterium]